MEDKNKQIHDKGFDIYNTNREAPMDYGRIKVGVKTLDDATLTLGHFKKFCGNTLYTNKAYIYKKIAQHDVRELRNISNYFYHVSGIYKRIIRYFAFLYRFDWYMTPEIYDETADEKKITKEFVKILDFLDGSYIRKQLGDISLDVIKDGAYYGYIVPCKDGLVLQQLPIEYCRSRYSVGGLPAIEFDMRYFDTFTDIRYREKVLNLFPKEFKKGYELYRQGKLIPDCREALHINDSNSWYLLDVHSSIKFSFSDDDDIPLFVSAIPSLLDLDEAQDIDRRKQLQKLLKIVVQKLPLDKNGDLIFDVDEARDIHNNAVEMLRRAVGVDVLTTFADIDSIDMKDSSTTTSSDDLERQERAVYNAFGASQNLFNSNSNLSLEKSILNDESSLRGLLLQFQIFFDRVVKAITPSNGKKYKFRFYMLETTQYNYKELSKMYKEQTQLGFSKMLPQIALGQSQSFILNTAKFENDVLSLTEIMIPPMSSSTMSADAIATIKDKGAENSGEVGRPEKADDQKSEKTIQNKESM